MELVTQMCCEVEEVLAHTKMELVEKIPSNVRKFFIDNSKDVIDYEAKYNIEIPLKEQDLLEETKAVLTLFYRDYWCTPEEKIKLEKILDENEKKYQEELREKYNPDVFANNSNFTRETKKEETMPAMIVELKWYQKIFEKIKMFLSKK